MINIENKEMCCGCTACYSACPINCIVMESDCEGFLYPQVDKNKCINCGKCESVCPIMNPVNKDVNQKVDAYAIQCNEEEFLSLCTSGGFFPPLARHVIEQGGIVYGVTYRENNFEVVHKSSEKVEEIWQFCGSKYVQSNLGDTFKNIKSNLNQEKMVLFSGTPCQVEGLLHYLGKTYDNLITVDLICHGTPSPLLWKKYTEYQENKNKSKIIYANFRNKTYGYHSGTMKLKFESGKEYVGSARVDYMLKPFFSEISSRPSCYNCKFKSSNHRSDFTIYDCWSASKLNSSIIDLDKGFTNLMVNTDRGRNILDKINRHYSAYPVDIDKQIKLDGPMVCNSATPHKERQNFYTYLNEFGIDKTMQMLIPVSKKDLMIEKSKGFLYKIGLMQTIKRLKQ